MFVYLLIAAELAILYVAFWYLYVREPKHKGHISGSLWGAYHEIHDEQQTVDPYLQWLQAHGEAMREGDKAAAVAHLEAAYACAEEFIWDARLNRYVPVREYEARSFLAKMAEKLDRSLSQFNVRP